MDISIIIVGWNSRHYLEECLDSLSVAPPSRSVEIIVVDNASTDGSADLVEAKFPHVKLIRSGENLGFAKANNLAIQESRGRYIGLVNPDVEVLPGCLDALADYLDQNPGVGNVGPRVLNSDRTLQSSCRQFPTLWNNFCSATGLASALPSNRLFSGEHMLFFPHDRTMPVDVLVGCFWMLRADAVKDIGLLDESFFMYGEDVDWCKRCWQAGWKIVFLPGAEAIHHRGTSAAAQPVWSAVEQQRSLVRYWSKHHGLYGRLGIQSILFCHHVLRYLFGTASGFLGASRHADSGNRVHVSLACLHALFSENAPRKA
ncbi:MAG: glycosyltransferase family 2 protein [Candidatus Sulfotelmatobacter sp.]